MQVLKGLSSQSQSIQNVTIDHIINSMTILKNSRKDLLVVQRNMLDLFFLEKQYMIIHKKNKEAKCHLEKVIYYWFAELCLLFYSLDVQHQNCKHKQK